MVAGCIVVLDVIAATQPRRDMIEGHLLNKGHSVPPVVPPLEDQDEPGDERGRAGEGHVELGSLHLMRNLEIKIPEISISISYQSGEKHGRHGDVIGDAQRTS